MSIDNDPHTARAADILIAKDQIKEIPDQNNLNDAPYIHNSSQGYGFQWLSGISGLDLLREGRPQRIYLTLLVAITAMGLVIYSLLKIF